MTAEETARILCDPNAPHSEFERAILLFGLQAAILSPMRPQLASWARLHAATKILEFIENTNGCSEGMSLTERLGLPGYEKILDQMLAREGSWRNIARAWTRRELAQDLNVRWDEARDAARIIQFSYRFAKLKTDDRRLGGVTMARYFVCKTHRISDGTMKQRLREYGKTAVFGYLLKEIGLRPAKLTSKKFVETLLSQVTDVGRIQRFFAAYRDMSFILRSRGYQCESLVIEGLAKTQVTLEIRDFSPVELKIIGGYGSRP